MKVPCGQLVLAERPGKEAEGEGLREPGHVHLSMPCGVPCPIANVAGLTMFDAPPLGFPVPVDLT